MHRPARGVAPRAGLLPGDFEMSDPWLATLITETPQDGYDLAVKLARVAVKMTQPDAEIRTQLRADYEGDFGALIAASEVVATHFQTVAAANNYWRD